jgi:hypothetical protein
MPQSSSTTQAFNNMAIDRARSPRRAAPAEHCSTESIEKTSGRLVVRSSIDFE